jgi:nucleoside-diphosphate-sugar epimerase
MSPKILIIGANGQIGTELTTALAARHGSQAVVSADLAPVGRVPGVVHAMLDATEGSALTELVERHGITHIYLLAAALSARGEQHQQWAWDLNMKSLLNVLELARTHKLERVFWPRNPPRCTVFPNWRVRAGVPGTTATMEWMCAACAIPA